MAGPLLQPSALCSGGLTTRLGICTSHLLVMKKVVSSSESLGKVVVRNGISSFVTVLIDKRLPIVAFSTIILIDFRLVQRGAAMLDQLEEGGQLWEPLSDLRSEAPEVALGAR